MTRNMDSAAGIKYDMVSAAGCEHEQIWGKEYSVLFSKQEFTFRRLLCFENIGIHMSCTLRYSSRGGARINH